MKPLVLIVDDNAMNRMVLSDMLGDDYTIAEACDGAEAIEALHDRGDDIALMLLDIMMPKVNGLEVLEYMNANQLTDTIPVIIVSAESETQTVSKAFDLGATDYINRNFDSTVVKRRVENAIMLYAKQKRLVGMVASQIYERERSNSLMVSILSHIVEFRNQESGMHVQNIRKLTELILGHLAETHPELEIDADYISIVSMASALHDIGKIAIPEEILNKPGRLTDEEFATMKTHSMEGAKMLEKIPFVQSEPLVKNAYEITRWHHERHDGFGYPDGLSGDEIPLSAQVVSLADVYDALTSERAYKAAFSHQKACEMILNGECGQFNPMLLEALKELDTKLSDVMDTSFDEQSPFETVDRIVSEISSESDLTPLSKTLEKLEMEREKYNFFTSLTNEIHFEYLTNPSMLVMPENSAEYFGISRKVFDPWNDEKIIRILGGREGVEKMLDQIRNAKTSSSIVDLDIDLYRGDTPMPVRTILRITRDENTGNIVNVIGRFFELNDESIEHQLARASRLDSLTGLHEADSFESLSKALLSENEYPYAMIMIDADDFRIVNEECGQIVGNTYLKEMADRMRNVLRAEDLVARIGGDEFLVLAQSDKDQHSVIERLQKNLSVSKGDGPQATVSIGVAYTEDLGRDYRKLCHACEKALHSAKEAGKDRCVVYDDSMAGIVGDAPSAIKGTQRIYGWRRTDLHDEKVSA